MSPDQIYAAALQADPNMSDAERRIRVQVRAQAGFYRHACTYVLVMSLIWVLCWFTIPAARVGNWRSWWAIWPTFGWGIGVLVHGVSVMTMFGRWGADWEERKVQELLQGQQRL